MILNSFQNPETLIEKISQKAITFADESQKIMSPEGAPQEWLIDLRPILLDVAALDIITNAFWDEFAPKLPFQIGGMEVAAVPLVTALLLKAQQRGLNTNGFIIRKERKTTGLGKLIEGEVTSDPIILVDDILNSGNSLEKARAALMGIDRKIAHVFVVLDYENQAAKQWAHSHKIMTHSLLTLEPLPVTMTRREWKPLSHKYTVIWRFLEKGAFPFHTAPKSTPLLVGDHIYMGTESGKMVCIDRHTGEALWKYDTKTHHNKGIWSSPAHYEGKIYFGAYNGIAYCLDAKTGAEIWKNPCCDFIGSSPLIVPEHNMLYIGLEHQRPRQMGSNAALDLTTGARKWERAQKKYQHGSATYYKPKDLVIFGNADHDVTAYNAQDGKVVWKHETERSIKYPPTVDLERGIVIATSFDGHIYILDVETGARKAAIPTDDICYTSALVTHGKIFAGSGDKHMYVIDADTYTLVKKLDCHARVYPSPRLIDGKVIFGTGGGRLIELDPDTLEVTSYAQLPDAISNALSANEDASILYVSTIMNELYAVQRTVVDL